MTVICAGGTGAGAGAAGAVEGDVEVGAGVATAEAAGRPVSDDEEASGAGVGSATGSSAWGMLVAICGIEEDAGADGALAQLQSSAAATSSENSFFIQTNPLF